METCLATGMTPHSLTILIKCHAFQSDATPVEQQFKETTKSAQESLLQSLANYYCWLREQQSQEAKELEQTMHSTFQYTRSMENLLTVQTQLKEREKESSET